MDTKQKTLSTVSHEKTALLICAFTAVITLQDSAVLQYCFGFIAGFAESLFRAF